ncbi:RNA polymerase sigma factor SigM [Nocardioides sp. zg-1228]|uniref:RNA polymerase sigma factor SigM n=1 Tax=Nocardioides sp. zg-1228 TaxID=2763008 RepID=UPI0016432676|nr:RNA polymerase sigma factor SigM [Nocardioides sp. zg-1228]MBC2932124.1 RNA polymerase sigma factor SigM [Nocardioides sp. zg-1228]QSF57667.1 RNA polymerase sigma factor SigM [Nocardioides sp. zg-1228]
MSTAASDERSDQALLQAHVDGDAEAFGVLFARHRDRLWAVALRTMGNPEDAADGLQDAMIAAFRRAGSYRGEAAVTTWLHRVVVNACLDRIRSARIRRLEALPDDVEDRGTVVATAVRDDRPDEVAVDSERRRRVLDALATLPAEQRAALVLVDMEGYPVAEVARMLGCAEGTVKSRCSRGRTKLAGILADLQHPAGDPPHGNPPPDGPVQPSVRPRGPPAP